MAYFRNKYLFESSSINKLRKGVRSNCTIVVFCETMDGFAPKYDFNGNEITDDRWELCDKTCIKDLGCDTLFVHGARYFGYL